MTSTVEDLTTAAGALLDALGPLAADARFPFDADHRRWWTYLPGSRPGVATVDLDRPAGRALHRLLATTVSPHTHAQVAAIMSLADPLSALQGSDRHVGDYWVAVYGEPGGDRWAWRLGGHHVSVRATVAGDRVRVTPLFLGANPARVLYQGVATSQPLAPEEVLGFRMLAGMSDAERRTVVVDRRPPRDIVTGDAPLLADLPAEVGIRVAELGPEPRRVAEQLIDVYAARLADPLRRAYRGALEGTVGDLHVAWAGATTPPRGEHGDGHYYRIQGPRFLAELDDTQDHANHVHTVWRDPEGDHGRDLG